MQPAKIDALLEIDLRDARRLERSMPAMAGVEVALVDGKERGRVLLLLHRPAFSESRISRRSTTSSGGAGGAAALSCSRMRFTARTSRNTTNARIRKLRTMVMKLPYARSG